MNKVCGKIIEDCVECDWSRRQWSKTLSIVEDRLCLHPNTTYKSLGVGVSVPVPDWCTLPRIKTPKRGKETR